MLDKIVGLANCSLCITTKRINSVEHTIARCESDGDRFLCKCARNYEFESVHAGRCTHAFKGRLGPVLLNYLYVLPLLLCATYVVSVVLCKKARNVRIKRTVNGIPLSCGEKAKIQLWGNKIIFALNSLMVFVLARLFFLCDSFPFFL